MAFEFKLPDIGEGVHEGEIVQWLVKPGDYVKEDQAIVEVMTDKVTAEIPAPVSGVIKELRGKEGEVIPVGSVIAVFDEQAGATQPAAKAQPVEATAATATPNKAQTPTSGQASGKASRQAGQMERATNGNGKSHGTAPVRASGGKVLAAPATRKLARQLGIDLTLITGSGPRGRVTPTDVRQFSEGGGAPATSRAMPARATGFEPAGERRVPFSGMRRKIAEHLVKSKQTAPHFAYVEEADMSKLVAMREELLAVAQEQDVKLTYLPFMIKAVIAGLRKYPALNAQLDEERGEIVYKNDYHIGVAVATDQGLIVPVVKFADRKSLFELARDIRELAEKARTNKLGLDDLKGGTFTLTSIGSIGGLFSVPIINYPEVAIMGVNKIEKRPVVRPVNGEDRIVVRDIMNLSISCDHRVVDGAEAALFVKEVVQTLESPARLLL